MRCVLVLGLLLFTAGASPTAAQEFAAVMWNRGSIPNLEQARFTVGDYSCTVSIVGSGSCTSSSGTALKFRFRPERKGSDFEVVHALSDPDGLFLALEFDDSEGGWAQVMLVRPGRLWPVWRHRILSFNLPPPVRRGRDLYIAGLMYAARINVKTGKFVWRYRGVYKAGDIDAPKSLTLSDNIVIVRGTAGGEPKSMCFVQSTGAAVSCP